MSRLNVGERVGRSVVDLVWGILAGDTAILRFVFVGGLGYVLYQLLLFATYDTALLWFLPDKRESVRLIFFDHGDTRLLISTLLIAEITIVAVFTAHTLWSFRHRVMVDKPLLWRFGQFHGSQVASFAIGIVILNVLTVEAGIYHHLAAPIAASAAAAWNLLWATQVIWRRAERGERS